MYQAQAFFYFVRSPTKG